MDYRQQNQVWASLRQPSSTWVTKLLLQRREPRSRPALRQRRSLAKRRACQYQPSATRGRPWPEAGPALGARMAC